MRDPTGFVHRDEVGERSTNVDADPVRHGSVLPLGVNEAERDVACALLGTTPSGIAPTTAASRFGRDHVARSDCDAGLFGLQHALLAASRAQHVAVRRAILATQDAARAVFHAVARGVADRRLGDFDGELEVASRPAAIAPVAAAVGPELVAPEEQRESYFGDLDAAELDSARSLPLAGAGPAVAGKRRAAARTSLEQVPDERFSRARIHSLNRDAETAAPARHGTVRAGWGERLDHCLDDLLPAAVGGERHGLPRTGMDDGALARDDRDWAEGAVVL